MTLSLVVLVAVVGFSSPQVGQVSPDFAGVVMNDPLMDSHLIVRGRIEDVRTERSTLGGYGLVPLGDRGAGQVILVSRVSVSVDEVLKGRWSKREITFESLDDSSVVRIGQEYVICARWRVVNGVGTYVTGRNHGLYVVERPGVWTRLDVYKPDVPASEGAVRARIAEAGLPALTTSSDVVVLGVVEATWTATYAAGNGCMGVMRHHQMKVVEGFRGALSGDTVEFVTPVLEGASYLPPWTRYTPSDIRVGEEWFAFLKRGKEGLYAFAGPSSLLKVVGDELLFDSAVVCPQKKDEAQRIVRAEVSRAKD